MKALDLKTFEAALTDRSRELEHALAGRNRITVETSADELDNALRSAERESSAQALSQDVQLLRQVKAAQGRLRDGAYGICLRCEEQIAPKRLAAIPWAEYCVSCQAAAEEDSLDARAA